MAKYNIYKIKKTKEPILLEKLQTVSISLAGQKSVEGFSLSFYFSKEPEDIDIWWAYLYKDFRNQIIDFSDETCRPDMRRLFV